VILDVDPDRARSLGRNALTYYLKLSNYTNNWLRLGFNEKDLAGGGSDRLVDGLIAHGSAAQISARVAEHLAAGADHVCIQLIAPPGSDLLPGFAELAGPLLH